MTVQCCKCKRVRINNRWTAATGKEAVVSHSYCPKCFEAARNEIHNQLRLDRFFKAAQAV